MALQKSSKGANYTSVGFQISENTHVLHDYKNFVVESNDTVSLCVTSAKFSKEVFIILSRLTVILNYSKIPVD